MGHRHDVAAIVAAHAMQPAFPARRDHLRRFSLAGPITPKVLRPGIDLEPSYRIPPDALPAPEMHLDQILRRRGPARRCDAPGESCAPRGRAAVNGRARERLARYLLEYRLGCSRNVLLVHVHIQTTVAETVDIDRWRMADEIDLHRRCLHPVRWITPKTV